MKTAYLLLGAIGLAGCHHGHGIPPTPATADPRTAHVLDNEGTAKRRALPSSTEARVKTYEKRGFSNAEARAIAEAEYFRAGQR